MDRNEAFPYFLVLFILACMAGVIVFLTAPFQALLGENAHAAS